MDELLAVFSLPKFALPPVAEVAISMGFGSSLPLLRLASLAREVEGDFPDQREAPPVAVVPEADTPFAQALLQLQASPVVRFVCTSEDGERQVQFQNDLVGANWIRAGGTYPEFHTVRDLFDSAYGLFRTTGTSGGSDEPAPVVLDVTYVNIISEPEAVADPASLFKDSSGPLAGDLPMDTFSLTTTERMTHGDRFFGRILKNADVVAKPDTGERAIRITVSARIAAELLRQDVAKAMELAHAAAVSGFVAATSTDWQHDRWGRTE
ncbi:MAG TPA: hypothetical protein PKE05_09460 [Microthrixaceae bacterium]|nr:hypothetical protein [Microthrixaceae bacterium]